MRSILALATATLALTAGCGGGSDVLARVGEREITAADFREAFNRLSPSEQVDVLEPGGRLALVERLAIRNLLELALEDRGAPGADWWVEQYSDAWLAAQWTGAGFSEFAESGPSPEDLTGLARRFRLRIILLPDSATAALALSLWAEPDLARRVDMALAPWSIGEVSHRVLEGQAWQMPVEIETRLEGCEGSGPVIIPIYDAWAVAEIWAGEDQPVDSVPPEASIVAFSRHLDSLAGIMPSSHAIEEMSRHLEVRDGRYALAGSFDMDPSTVLVRYDGGGVTAGELAELIERTGAWSFFGQPPAELESLVMRPPMGVGAGIELWFYAEGVARTRWQADRGREAGLDPADAEIPVMASVEHLLRLEVLEAVAEPDSAGVMAYYQSAGSRYTIPERRSVLIAYVPRETADSLGTPASFDALSGWTPLDSLGAPVPTPPQLAEVFGPLAGPVFSAEPGAVCGPFDIGMDGLSAYVQVVEVVPPAPAAPGEIWSRLVDDCRAVRIQDAYAALLGELRSEIGIEIDTAAVENVDPWSGSF